jgi:uncharacterized membrane protein YkvA (DUF1232 family)
MANNNRNVQGQIGMLKGLVNHGRLVFRLLKDSRVPLYLKALPIASLVYLVSPIDFIPDVLIGLGQLDDIGAVLIGIETFIKLCPQDVVAEIRADIDGDIPYTQGGKPGSDTIEGKYRTK